MNYFHSDCRPIPLFNYISVRIHSNWIQWWILVSLCRIEVPLCHMLGLEDLDLQLHSVHLEKQIQLIIISWITPPTDMINPTLGTKRCESERYCEEETRWVNEFSSNYLVIIRDIVYMSVTFICIHHIDELCCRAVPCCM